MKKDEDRYNKFAENLMKMGIYNFSENFNQFLNEFGLENLSDLPILYRIYYVNLLKPFVNERRPGFDPKSKYFRDMISDSITLNKKYKTKELVDFVVMQLKAGRASTFLEKKKELKGKGRNKSEGTKGKGNNGSGKKLTKLEKLRKHMYKKKERIKKEAEAEVVNNEKRINPLMKRLKRGRKIK